MEPMYSKMRPTPIGEDIRINWIVYEFASRWEARQYVLWAQHVRIETRGATTIDGRHFVWSRD